MHIETAPAMPFVHVLGGLSLSCDGRRLAVPPGSRRLLAYLALHPGGVDRRVAAGVLWPDVGDCRAAGNLRSALWRLQQVGCPLVAAEQSWLGLRDDVDLDLARLEAWATRVLGQHARLRRPGRRPRFDRRPGAAARLVRRLGAARTRAAALRLLHALEALSRLLRRAGRPAAAVEAMTSRCAPSRCARAPSGRSSRPTRPPVTGSPPAVSTTRSAASSDARSGWNPAPS